KPKNGTAIGNTTAIQSIPGCREAEGASMQGMASTVISTGYKVSVTAGCNHTFTIHPSATGDEVYGSGVFVCDGAAGEDDRFLPVMFYILNTSDPILANGGTVNVDSGRVIVCAPTLNIYEVLASVDINKEQLLAAQIIGNITGVGNSVSGNPLNGRALNGLGFNTSSQNVHVQNQIANARNSLAAAIFQTVSSGQDSAFQNGQLLSNTTSIYTTFLTIVAAQTYFSAWADGSVDIAGAVKSVEPRLWVSRGPAHVLAGIFGFLAISALLVAIIHARQRRYAFSLVLFNK
ncbi:hypothetical protein BT69DRAFT_1304959, partial [Atractiella rhizophila]